MKAGGQGTTREPDPQGRNRREMLTINTIMDLSSDQQVMQGQWHPQAACFGSTQLDFFPQTFSAATMKPLREVCSTCDVRLECLTFAIVTRQGGGVWGGRKPREREAIVRKIKKAGYRIG